jgi:SpoVK/Ycf46/Vps4 family AAA+-type ATPase
MSIKKARVYAGVTEQNDNVIPVPVQKLQKRLEPGVYTTNITPEGQFYFKTMSVNCDNIIDLPSPEYKQVVYDIETFLKPETKQSFADHGFIYKRSALLYGIPGTGKTILVNRIISAVVKGGGVVLFNPHPELMPQAFSVLEDVQPEALTLVVFEEFDSLVDDYESELLSLLDGEVQKSNVMYLATTNNKEDIPKRILRPGRFSSLIEVKAANLEARTAFLQHKGATPEEAIEWAANTADFTIDELKEVVLSTKCLGYTFEAVLARVLDYKKEKPVDEKAIKENADFHSSRSMFSDPYPIMMPKSRRR